VQASIDRRRPALIDFRQNGELAAGQAFRYAGTYGNGLPEWLMASLGFQSQNEPGGGFARSPMDAYAQAR